MKHSHPAVTVDIVLFSQEKNRLQALLIKRGVEPYKNMWALPGGFVRNNETLDECATRELQEETGLNQHYLEQLYTFSDINRDPRERVITVAYFALLNTNKKPLQADTDVSDAKWFFIDDLPELAFDHNSIINYALNRLRAKTKYSTVLKRLLPTTFTLTELQKAYEAVLNQALDKRNFRKQILARQILQKRDSRVSNQAHRPAQLYSFKKKNIEYY